MNTEILKNAGIDFDSGVKRFVGRTQLYEKALLKFTRDTTFERIRAAGESGDRKQLLANAHEFKGMCGNVGLTSLYTAADSLVRLLRGDAPDAAEVDASCALLENEYHKIYEAVCAAMEA